MFQTIKSKAITLIAIIILGGCTTSQDHPHPKGITSANLNQAIQVIAPRDWNTFKIGDVIGLQIINVSNRSLVFDKNFGSRIFLVEDDQWIEVKNMLVSIGAENILMGPATNNKSETRGFSVNPEMSGRTSKTEVRIYIFGKFSDTEEVIGAFIDIVLRP